MSDHRSSKSDGAHRERLAHRKIRLPRREVRETRHEVVGDLLYKLVELNNHRLKAGGFA
jgi:hypothetical protein